MTIIAASMRSIRFIMSALLGNFPSSRAGGGIQLNCTEIARYDGRVTTRACRPIGSVPNYRHCPRAFTTTCIK